ncbi:SMR domain-containing protein At5g58720 isoform X10 [Gossypium hirsutum]|uniref:SMR domain-containing protein At5g58720 isoform X10 n=1 Tax=Gossypium hirsutum TaxID=3635 RepID=A0ABM3AWR5_GOSHI|nr:SMR domain-containing protein At5g58720-like isoform X10 [Gossypium hirsutum]
MTLPTSSLFPLSTPLPLLKIYRENGLDRWPHRKPDTGLAAAILMQNLSRISMAATAYSKGELEYAAYLSDQGKIQTKLARETDERASQNIFKARNKGFENVITIDLHEQHVKQAMRL